MRTAQSFAKTVLWSRHRVSLYTHASMVGHHHHRSGMDCMSKMMIKRLQLHACFPLSLSSMSLFHSTAYREQQQKKKKKSKSRSNNRNRDSNLLAPAISESNAGASSSASSSSSSSSPPPPLLRVAILGPPNAGKSTLFNRLLDKAENHAYKLQVEKPRKGKNKGAGAGSSSGGIRRRKLKGGGVASNNNQVLTQVVGGALVSAIPGTTRDRRQATGRIGNISFLLMDTAGVDGLRLESWYRGQQRYQKQKQFKMKKMKNNNPLGGDDDHDFHVQEEEEEEEEEEDDIANNYERPMMQQAMLAAQQADVIFFLFDGRVGLTADDLETCRWLRRHVLVSSSSSTTTTKTTTSQPHSADDDEETEEEENSESAHDNNLTKHPNIAAPPQKVVMVANKLEGTILDDNPLYQDFLTEASQAGFGPPVVISALQGEGMADLAVELLEAQQALGMDVHDDDDDKDEKRDSVRPPRPIQVAILGRPNVGKSTLVNALLQEQRVITGSRPGLTRDAIRIPWMWQGHAIQIVDTAGIRKASQRQEDVHPKNSNTDENMTTTTTKRRKRYTTVNSPALLEDMAVQDALRALHVADVAVLVIDANERMLTKQDLVIANAILQEGRCLVVVANKMDLVLDETNPEEPFTRQDLVQGVRQQLEFRFPYLRKTPIVPLDSRSSASGRNNSKSSAVADELMPVVLQAKARWERIVSTGSLNQWLAEVVDGHAPPAVQGRPTKLKYILQTKGRPPTFLLYTNQDNLPVSYMRYLTRQFQESFDMYGMQVRLAVKKSASSEGGNPYASKSSKGARGGFGLGGRQARQERGLDRLKATGTRKLVRRRKRQR